MRRAVAKFRVTSGYAFGDAIPGDALTEAGCDLLPHPDRRGEAPLAREYARHRGARHPPCPELACGGGGRGDGTAVSGARFHESSLRVAFLTNRGRQGNYQLWGGTAHGALPCEAEVVLQVLHTVPQRGNLLTVHRALDRERLQRLPELPVRGGWGRIPGLA